MKLARSGAVFMMSISLLFPTLPAFSAEKIAFGAIPIPNKVVQPASPFRTEDSGSLMIRPKGWPADVPSGLSCPLKHTRVNAVICGSVASVDVEQDFNNEQDFPVEATYTFPLPEHSAVDKLEMQIGDKEIVGSIKKTEEAQQIFNTARAAGQTAAMMKEHRPNVFSQEVTNIAPHSHIVVKLHYVDALPFSAGTYTFAFPTVVGSRFTPPPIAASPNSAAAGPDPIHEPPRKTRPGHDVSIDVEIHAPTAIENIQSFLHNIESTSTGKDAIVSLARKDEIPNRDFVLSWTISRDAIASGALTNSKNGDGYLMLSVLPPEVAKSSQIQPKEMIFIVDRSLSQEGDPIYKCKETLRYALKQLHSDDTFQLMSFAQFVDCAFDKPQPLNDENISKANSWVDQLRCGPYTFVMPAIEKLASYPVDPKRLRVVCLMTDGQVNNEHEALTALYNRKDHSRWFPFGTGNTVNRYFIDAVAGMAGGEPEYVSSFTPADEVARNFYDRISSPLLTDINVAFEGGNITDVYPKKLPDLWSDRPLNVVAKYSAPGTTVAHITGMLNGKPYKHDVKIELLENSLRNGALHSLWARRAIDDLLMPQADELFTPSDFKSDAVKNRVIELSCQNNVLSPYTSFIAVEKESSAKNNQAAKHVDVPEAPSANNYHYNENSPVGGLNGTAIPVSTPIAGGGWVARGGGGGGGSAAALARHPSRGYYGAPSTGTSVATGSGGSGLPPFTMGKAIHQPADNQYKLGYAGGVVRPQIPTGSVDLSMPEPVESKAKPQPTMDRFSQKESPRDSNFLQVAPSVVDERYQRTSISEKTLKLPGTLPPNAPLPAEARPSAHDVGSVHQHYVHYQPGAFMPPPPPAGSRTTKGSGIRVDREEKIPGSGGSGSSTFGDEGQQLTPSDRATDFAPSMPPAYKSSKLSQGLALFLSSESRKEHPVEDLKILIFLADADVKGAKERLEKLGFKFEKEGNTGGKIRLLGTIKIDDLPKLLTDSAVDLISLSDYR